MLVLLFIPFLIVNNSFAESKIISHDICKNVVTNRIYLDLNESGLITAFNLRNEINIKKCHLEVVTCDSCVIFINISFLNLSNNCTAKQSFPEEKCACEYLEIYEQFYEKISAQRYCNSGNNNTYKTVTKSVTLKFVYFLENNHAFTIELLAMRSRIFLKAEERIGFEFYKGYFQSPFFPANYAPNIFVEFIISCLTMDNCRIRLIFTDFQLAVASVLKVKYPLLYDWNGQLLFELNGVDLRPPILISKGPTITVRFHANGNTELGFRAEYSYIFDRINYNGSKIITGCGGYIDNLGGAITMLNLVEKGSKRYYCYWIIKPSENYLHFKTYLYLKIANFSGFESNFEIQVRKGSTSLGQVMEVFRYPNKLIQREYILPVHVGFYVRLDGTFTINSSLAIAFSAFGYEDCIPEIDFVCKNRRCIPNYLTCDGLDHCGDGSDEYKTCFEDSTQTKWYSHVPNYLFPKADPLMDLKIVTLIFIIIVFGSVIIVCLFFLLINRINVRARRERNMQNHIQIITDMLEDELTENELVLDDPPVYEAPPDYNEIIQVECDPVSKKGVSKIKKKRRTQKTKVVKEVAKSSKFRSSKVQRNRNTASSLPEAKSKTIRSNPLIYFTDKSGSSTKKWRSHEDLRVTKNTTETTTRKYKRTKKVVLYNRDTASDSEIISSAKNYQPCNIGMLKCEGACGCDNHKKMKYPRKWNKKVLTRQRVRNGSY